MNEVFLERLAKILPSQARSYFGKPALHTHFRVNTLKTSIQDALQQLQNMGVSFEKVEWYSSALSVASNDARSVLDSPLVSGGLLYPQGLESMKAVVELDPQPGEYVLDLCAAPGSKTSQIAAHMNNEGQLVANEPIRTRFYRLKSVLSLTGAQATLTMVDGRRFKISKIGDSALFLKNKRQQNRALSPIFFDRVLVDAPCSAEGRFKESDPKTYAYWSPRKIKEMSHKQKGLLLNASRLVKPGGILVYSTCTFAPEENEEVVEWFARKTQDFQLKLQEHIWPDGRMEGFFIAKWKKI